MALNSLVNVYPHHMALGQESGSIWLADDMDYAQDARPRYRLPLVRLDDFYDQPRLDLLKIDVEGMEASVLQDAERAIRRHRPIIYAENERGGVAGESLIALLRGQGYRVTPPQATPVFCNQLHGERDGSVPRNRVGQPALHIRVARGEPGTLPALMPMRDSGGLPTPNRRREADGSGESRLSSRRWVS